MDNSPSRKVSPNIVMRYYLRKLTAQLNKKGKTKQFFENVKHFIDDPKVTWSEFQDSVNLFFVV